jgi:hypothetical protein
MGFTLQLPATYLVIDRKINAEYSSENSVKIACTSTAHNRKEPLSM